MCLCVAVSLHTERVDDRQQPGGSVAFFQQDCTEAQSTHFEDKDKVISIFKDECVASDKMTSNKCVAIFELCCIFLQFRLITEHLQHSSYRGNTMEMEMNKKYGDIY